MKVQINDNASMNSKTAHPRVTDKYKFIDTAEIVTKFESYGWTAVKYNEARTRKFQGYQTHTVHLTHMDESVTKVGDSSLRIIIVNNHHAGTSLQIKLGLFRLVCSNGMVVQDADHASTRIRHIGLSVDAQISEFIDKISIAAERLRAQVNQLTATKLDETMQRELAKRALTTRFKPELITNDMITAVLRPRRIEDTDTNAWVIFNRVQEGIIKGFKSDDKERATRKVTSLKRDLDINEQLWAMLPMAA
jgi:hypothetical protein